jgi:hypothetical protein
MKILVGLLFRANVPDQATRPKGQRFGVRSQDPSPVRFVAWGWCSPTSAPGEALRKNHHREVFRHVSYLGLLVNIASTAAQIRNGWMNARTSWNDLSRQIARLD